MGLRASFEDRGSYLLCQFAGRFELADRLELTREIRAYCTEHGHRRVLVDVRESQGTLGPLDRYQHAIEMARPGSLGVRTAVVARPDQVFPDRFWETVTRNRGLVTRVVTDMEEAIVWLAQVEP
jgi:hypothetical protein